MGTDLEPDAMQYVYAVVPAGLTRLPVGPGIEGGAIRQVSAGKIAALTSRVGSERVRPSRANLSAHQDVVSEAHRRSPALPVRFGTVVPDERSVVEELLAPAQREFETMLAEFEGKDEFRVKARYLPDVALREVVGANRPINRLREKIRSAGPAAPQGDRIRLGELVAAGLERLSEIDADALLRDLSPHIEAWEPIDLLRRGESGRGGIDARMQMATGPSDDVPFHAALLVDRSRTGDLEAALERFAAEQKDRMEFELVGPLPLWDFSHVTAGAT